jgi:CRP-like cAMP-binding protein
MHMSRDNIRAILKQDSWYANLPEALQEQLLSIGVPRSLEEGRRLFSRGDATCGVYCVLEGRLAAFAVNEQGDEAIQIHLEPGQWFGEIGLFDKLPRMHTVRSAMDSSVLWLDDAKLRAMLMASPEHWPHFSLLLTKKLRLALFVLDGRMLSSNELRVARLILMIARQYEPGGTAATRRITVDQQEVAEMLGMSRQTVNQILQRLKLEGLIELAYNKVEIKDFEALQHKVQYENWLRITPDLDDPTRSG